MCYNDRYYQRIVRGGVAVPAWTEEQGVVTHTDDHLWERNRHSFGEEQMAPTVTKGEWEDFLAIGRVPPRIRRDVLQSWERSAKHQVQSLKRAPRLAEEDLVIQRSLARRLRHGAQTALTRAGKLLSGTDTILLLCDRSGVVLDAAGDKATLARGGENHLHLGGNWAEDAIGTNAIGTALKLGRPVVVRETEHFCEEIQRWNCAATPIIDPGTGLPLGVVDISWPNGISQANSIALSTALALQVESEITRHLAREREKLMELIDLRRLRRGNEPMLILDRSGKDVFATEDFARYCNDHRAPNALRQRIPHLIEQTVDLVAEALSDCLPGSDLEVLADQGEAIGVMISLRRPDMQIRQPVADLNKIGTAGAASADLCAQAQRLARTGISLLIEGETGTGKTYLAQAIHRASPKADGPFELIDCSRLTADRLREDIAQCRFGAPDGVLCFNGPCATSPDVQEQLLNLVQDVSQRGVRLITLSTRSLYAEMERGTFRSDLYYRLAGARLEIQPLRARPDEIEPLLRELVMRHAARSDGRELRFTSGALMALRTYDWPGNLLEMNNLIATLDALSPTGLIDERALPSELRGSARPQGAETLRDKERIEILNAIEAEGGNLSRVARRLGIARSTLYLKLDSYGIQRARLS